MQSNDMIYVVTMVIYIAISAFVMTRKNTQEIIKDGKLSKKKVLWLAVLFVWSFISLSNVSTFIYFQF